MKKTSKKILGKVSPIKVKKAKIVEEEVMEQIKEVIAPTIFKEGDILEDKSSGKRFHFHNQSSVLGDLNRFKIVG